MGDRLVRAHAGHPELIEWLEEQEIDPESIRPILTLHDTGHVTVRRFLTDSIGKRYVDPETNEAAVEPVTIAPTRPLPEEVVIP